MALADPQVIPFPYGNSSVARVASGDGTSRYRRTGDTGAFDELVISHQSGKRNRSVVRLNISELQEDPVSETNLMNQISVYLVVDAPKVGFTQDIQRQMVAGLCGWLTASSGANTLKVLGGES